MTVANAQICRDSNVADNNFKIFDFIEIFFQKNNLICILALNFLQGNGKVKSAEARKFHRKRERVVKFTKLEPVIEILPHQIDYFIQVIRNHLPSNKKHFYSATLDCGKVKFLKFLRHFLMGIKRQMNLMKNLSKNHRSVYQGVTNLYFKKIGNTNSSFPNVVGIPLVSNVLACR